MSDKTKRIADDSRITERFWRAKGIVHTCAVSGWPATRRVMGKDYCDGHAPGENLDSSR